MSKTKKLFIVTGILVLMTGVLIDNSRVLASGIQALATLFVGTTPIVGGTNTDCLNITAGKLGQQACSSGGTIAHTTNALIGDGAGNANAASGTGTNCVLVDGSSAACSAGSGTGAVYVGALSGIPATCTTGQYSIITDATVGQGLYFCTATNTWIQQWTPLPGSGVLLSFNPTTAAETFSIDPNWILSSPAPGATPNLNTNGSQRIAIAVCTTTCTVSVPVPAHDFQFCVMNDDNVSTVITMSALGSSAYYENTGRTAYGTAGTGTFVSGGAVGDMVCIYGRDATHYLTTAFKGSWTAN